MEADERALFDASVLHATSTADGAALDDALDELGWRDALEADVATAVTVLFESQGATTTHSAALDWLLADALGIPGGHPSVVLPSLRQTGPPGRLDGGRCLVQGLTSAVSDRCDRVLVVVGSADDAGVFAIEPAQIERRRVQGLDPSLELFDVAGEFELADAAPLGGADWPRALALGQLALGHDLLGNGRVMLELARTHALERNQFGRPIGSFQAVRHRLADSLVVLEASAALLDASWEDLSPVTAPMAKAFTGRSVRTVARHCQQVLAGIGFTTEHPLHRSVRRTIVLDQLLGAGSLLTRRLGTDIVERATLPPAFPL